jgi:hypothetical protein
LFIVVIPSGVAETEEAASFDLEQIKGAAQAITLA